MDAVILRASLVSQRDAADWYASARQWQDKAQHPGSEIVQSAAVDFAKQDQGIAARLALADRTFRGLEA